MKCAARDLDEWEGLLEPTEESEWQSETTFTFDKTPASVKQLLTQHKFVDAIKAAIANNDKDRNHLSDLVFFTCHPERCCRLIEKGETAVANQWLQIRKELVDPLLQTHG